jgi:NadR type nicotinamide-nucleotide adenylyltransferase
LPKRIAITGPESSGKTTLAKQLASYYDCIWVPEFARTYLTELGRPYTVNDLAAIGKGQLEWNRKCGEDSPRLIIYDTDLTVIKIWSEVRFGYSEKTIKEAFENEHNDLTLLCRPDLPWQPDPLRENPSDREKLFELYLEALEQKKAKFVIVEGQGEQRINSAIHAVDRILKMGLNQSPFKKNATPFTRKG